MNKSIKINEIAATNVETYSGISYRNIYTIINSENLFDDLIQNKPEKNEILQKVENNSSGISHQTIQKNRVFEYGDIESSVGNIFNKPYGEGRFGDGINYGIWYGALDEMTSISEALYHQLQMSRNDFKYNSDVDKISVERKMFQVQLDANKIINFTKLKYLHSNLTSDDYTFSHQIGKFLFNDKFDMFLTPSARCEEGICSPVFKSNVIKSEKVLYFMRFIFNRNGKVEIERISQSKSEFIIPNSW